jgi:CMP-N-acetylneuraminic acid synthetase
MSSAKPICIIPARGGSRRIPGKNIKPFFGKPIILYSIDKATDSGLFSDIVVTTDSEEIADVVRQYGASVYMRPHEYGHDSVGTQEVAAQYVRTLINPPALVCVVYATAPLMHVADLIKGYHMVREFGTNFVFSVRASPLQDAGQFYWCFTSKLLDGSLLVGSRTRLVAVPDNFICDINTPEDWDKALRMYELLGAHE